MKICGGHPSRASGAHDVISLSSLLVPGRANFEPYGISPIGLSFKRPEQEAEYQAFILKVTIAYIRVSLIFGGVALASTGALDPFIYDTPGSLTYALLMRFLVLVPPPLLLFLATFRERYRIEAQFAAMTAVCMVGIGFFLIAAKSNALTLVYTFPAIAMVTTYAFFFAGLFFRYGFAASAFVNAIYSVAIWTIDVSIAMAIAVDFSMIMMFLLFAMAAYQKELISRQLFVSETREREALARQNQSDTRYLLWLRQLAKFLRHEVRQPVAQINSSIEIVQLRCRHDDRLTPYLASASLGAQQVWNLIERASQATDAEAFVRQGQPQLTDLALLLAEQLNAFRQSNCGIDFRLKSPSVVRVCVDPILIKEAVGNMLGNAASFADEGSTVEVALTVDSAHAAVQVSNKGPTIEGDIETLFGPFASTRAGPSSEHQGLGLYLVRLIAEHHGGRAAIANLADGSGVQVEIQLPLPT
jgi:signal transduction histidine kinase